MIRNPVLVLVIGLPALAVVGSFASLAVSLRQPDSELPEQYHWEGFQLDRDFSRSERAAQLGVRATLRNISVAGQCEIGLGIEGAPPEQLSLTLAHATLGGLDRHVEFRRVSGRYIGECTDIPDGHWRLELADGAHSWSVRESVRGVRQTLHIDAATADDD